MLNHVGNTICKYIQNQSDCLSIILASWILVLCFVIIKRIFVHTVIQYIIYCVIICHTLRLCLNIISTIPSTVFNVPCNKVEIIYLKKEQQNLKLYEENVFLFFFKNILFATPLDYWKWAVSFCTQRTKRCKHFIIDLLLL